MKKLILFLLFSSAVIFGQTLTGTSPFPTYGGLLHFNGNGGVTSSLQNVYDGKGGLTALQLSTLGVYVNGTLGITGDFTAPNVAYNNAWAEPQEGMIFDGTDDYISIPDNANLNFGTGDFSIIFLFETSDNNFYLYNKNNSGWGSTEIGITVKLQPSVSYFNIGDGTYYQHVVTNNLGHNDGNKHLLIISYDRTLTKPTIYLDGNVINSSITGDNLNLIGNINYNASLYIGKYSSYYMSGKPYRFVFLNKSLTSDENKQFYNNGKPELAEIPFKYRWGSQTAQISGTLVIGKAYRINTYVSGDDFTNVGASSNASGVEFVAIGTTPTTWTNSSSLVRIGAVLDIEGKNMGSFGVVDASSNHLNGLTGGSPQILHKGNTLNYVDTKIAITGATTLSNFIPAGYEIESIYFNNTTANAVTGGIKIGTASGGTQIVNAGVVSGSAEGLFTLGTTFFSSSADQTIYVDAITAWNAASVDIIVRMKKIN